MRDWLLSVAAPPTPRRARVYAALVAAAGGGLALAYALRHGPGSMGDTAWYVNTANALLGFDWQAVEWVRPPGYPALLAVLFLLGGGENLTLVSVVQCGFLALTAFIAFLLAQAIKPGSGWLPVLVAAAVAFNPTAVQNAAIILTEPFVMLLLTAFAYTFVRAVQEDVNQSEHPTMPTLRRVLGWQGGMVLFGLALATVRVDMLGTVLPCLLLSIFFGSSRSLWQRLRFALVGIAAILALTGVVSLAQSLGGAPIFLASGATTDEAHRQFGVWATTFNVSEQEWKRMVYNETADVETLPSGSFNTTQEREKTERLLTELAKVGTSPELERQWAQLAHERRKADPLGYYIGLPLRRSLEFWFFVSPVGSAGIAGGILKAYYGLYALLFGFGALAALVMLFLRHSLLSLVAWTAALRTYSILGAGVLTGVGFYEQRYVRCAQPLILLTALLAGHWLFCRFVRTRERV